MWNTYALPSAHHAGTKQCRALSFGEIADFEGIVSKECGKFGDELFELTESQERAVLGPIRASDTVSILPKQNNARGDDRLAGIWIGSEALKARLTDTVQEAEICWFAIISHGLTMFKLRILTYVHDLLGLLDALFPEDCRPQMRSHSTPIGSGRVLPRCSLPSPKQGGRRRERSCR